MSFDLFLFSKFRPQLMGFATLLIILCHASASNVLMPKILANLFTFGNLGVDIFLFLSGIGCYYSLSKGGSILSYYKRRFIRLIVPYSLIYSIVCLIDTLIGRHTLLNAFLDFTTLGFWLYHWGAWFVALIIPIYILSPLLYKLSTIKYSFIFFLLIIIVLIILCNLGSIEKDSENIIYNIQWSFIRSVNFVLGFSLSPYCQSHTKINFLWFNMIIIVLYIILKYSGYNDGSRTWSLALLISVYVCLLFEFFCCKSILTGLSFIGNISLESYLTNIGINRILLYLIPSIINSPVFYGRYLEYSFVILFGIIWAIMANRLSIRINKRFVN